METDCRLWRSSKGSYSIGSLFKQRGRNLIVSAISCTAEPLSTSRTIISYLSFEIFWYICWAMVSFLQWRLFSQIGRSFWLNLLYDTWSFDHRLDPAAWASLVKQAPTEFFNWTQLFSTRTQKATLIRYFLLLAFCSQWNRVLWPFYVEQWTCKTERPMEFYSQAFEFTRERSHRQLNLSCYVERWARIEGTNLAFICRKNKGKQKQNIFQSCIQIIIF